jgi:hypothetical protein
VEQVAHGLRLAAEELLQQRSVPAKKPWWAAWYVPSVNRAISSGVPAAICAASRVSWSRISLVT